MGSYSKERKHLWFMLMLRAKDAKTDRWEVTNGECDNLGRVVYRPGWRRYVHRFKDFSGDFDANCYDEMTAFLRQQTAALKAIWLARRGGG